MAIPVDLLKIKPNAFSRGVTTTKATVKKLSVELKANELEFRRQHGCHFGSIDTSGKISRETETRRYHGAFCCVNGSSDTTMPKLREIVQNMCDAIRRRRVTDKSAPEGRIDFATDKNMFICSDNGCGMEYDELEAQFLTSSRSNKRGAKRTDGGHGIGRRLILFSHSGWMLATNHLLVIGFHEKFLVHCRSCHTMLSGEACSKQSCLKALKGVIGTQLVLQMPKDSAEYMGKALKHLFNLFSVDDVAVVHNGKLQIPAIVHNWPESEEDQKPFKVYKASAALSNQVQEGETIFCIMTHLGMPMFETRGKGFASKGYFLVRLKPSFSSYNFFTPERKGFTDEHQLASFFDEWLQNRRTDDIRQAMHDKITEIGNVRLDAILPLQERSRIMAACDDFEVSNVSTKGKAELEDWVDDEQEHESDDDQDELEIDSDQLISGSKCTARIVHLLHGPRLNSLASMSKTRCQRREDPIELEKSLYHVVLKLKDAGSRAEERLREKLPIDKQTFLLLHWAACVRFVMAELPSRYLKNPALATIFTAKTRFEVGFVLSESVKALNDGYSGTDPKNPLPYSLMLINPLTEVCIGGSDSKQSFRELTGYLLQYACHEVVHVVADCHDEKFATHMTELAVALAMELATDGEKICAAIQGDVDKALRRLTPAINEKRVATIGGEPKAKRSLK